MRFETKKVLKKLKPYCSQIIKTSNETHYQAILKDGITKITFSMDSKEPMRNWNQIRQSFKRYGNVELPLK